MSSVVAYMSIQDYEKLHVNQQRQRKYNMAFRIMIINFTLEVLMQQVPGGQRYNMSPDQLIRYSDLTREKANVCDQLRALKLHNHDT